MKRNDGQSLLILMVLSSIIHHDRKPTDSSGNEIPETPNMISPKAGSSNDQKSENSSIINSQI
jgi:hypothetical protein